MMVIGKEPNRIISLPEPLCLLLLLLHYHPQLTGNGENKDNASVMMRLNQKFLSSPHPLMELSP